MKQEIGIITLDCIGHSVNLSPNEEACPHIGLFVKPITVLYFHGYDLEI
jgi:hypothetical protein